MWTSVDFACPVSIYLLFFQEKHPSCVWRTAPSSLRPQWSKVLVGLFLKAHLGDGCQELSSGEGEPWAQGPWLGGAETGRDQGWLSICIFSLSPQSCPPFQYIFSQVCLFLKTQSQLPNKPQTSYFVKKERPKMAKSYGTLHFFTYWINHSFSPLPKHQSISPH